MRDPRSQRTAGNLYPYALSASIIVIVAVGVLPAQYLPQHPLYGLLRWLELYAYRVQVRFTPAPVRSAVRVIEFDDEFFRRTRARVAPLDRGALAEVLDRLAAVKPRVVVIDIELRYRLRSLFEHASAWMPMQESWLEQLDRDDDRLAAALRKLADATRIVLVAPGQRSLSDAGMPLVADHPNLYFADPRATIQDPDHVIYELPLWETRASEPRGPVRRQARPSFALACWAAYHGIPSSYFLDKTVPADLTELLRRDLAAFESGRRVYVNYGYRISPDEKVMAFQPVSAGSLLGMSGATPGELEGKVVIIGRTAYLREPVVEREDRHPTPHLQRKLAGVYLQGIFADNLLNRIWVAKATWWSGLLLGTLLGILMSSFLIGLAHYASNHTTPPFLDRLLTDPILSLGFGVTLSMIFTFVINIAFLKQGVYAVSFILLPMTGYVEAMLYAWWKSSR